MDLIYSKYTSILYQSYRQHLGVWRYYLLLEVQAILVPDTVRHLLRLSENKFLTYCVNAYGVIDFFQLQFLVRSLLIPPQYFAEVEKLKSNAN